MESLVHKRKHIPLLKSIHSGVLLLQSLIVWDDQCSGLWWLMRANISKLERDIAGYVKLICQSTNFKILSYF